MKIISCTNFGQFIYICLVQPQEKPSWSILSRRVQLGIGADEMIALSYHIRSLRWTSSVAYVVVTTPSALVVWSVAKTLSFILPRRIGNAGDELFYEMFQRTLLFLFEDMTGTQVIFLWEIVFLRSCY